MTVASLQQAKKVSKPLPCPDSPHPTQWCSCSHRGLPTSCFHKLCRLKDSYPHQVTMTVIAFRSHLIPLPIEMPQLCCHQSGVLPLSPTMATWQYPWVLHSDLAGSGLCCHCSAARAHCKVGSKAKKISGVNSSADLAQFTVSGHI